jgi:hypothetical protein
LAVPLLVFVPAKLAAVWLIGSGRPGRGVAALLVAKVIGTAVVARIFALTRPALLQLPWFAAFYARWLAWKNLWLARVRASWAWRAGRAVARAARPVGALAPGRIALTTRVRSSAVR